jgi:hypothetical protein
MVPYAIRRFLAHRRADRWLLIRAFIWLGAIDVALRLVGFRRIIEHGALRTACQVEPRTLQRAQRYAWSLEVASRYQLVDARCLHRSLALHCWLRREKIPSELRIGVRKDGDTLSAHAWVELEGCVVNDYPPAVAGFTPLASAPAQRWTTNDNPGSSLRGESVSTDTWGVQWQ